MFVTITVLQENRYWCDTIRCDIFRTLKSWRAASLVNHTDETLNVKEKPKNKLMSMIRPVTSTIWQILQLVPRDTLQMLVVALVYHSRLDYGNSVLTGIPAYPTRRLQSVLNAAARLIYKLRPHHWCFGLSPLAADTRAHSTHDLFFTLYVNRAILYLYRMYDEPQFRKR